MKRADAVLASVQGVREIMERCHRRKVFLMSETGCFARPDAVRPEKNGREFRLLWAGRMIPTKQLALALKTLSYLRDLPDLKLHVCGGGEKERDCRNLAERLGVEGKCVWHGMVSNEEVQGFMRGSDLFFFPSIMEATSTVLVEALMNRLPVLCFDTCGMGTIVDETVGCKIPLSRSRTVRPGLCGTHPFLFPQQENIAGDGWSVPRQAEGTGLEPQGGKNGRNLP